MYIDKEIFLDIAIIQTKEDLDRALDHFKPQETFWLSVSSAASYFLTKRNIQFSTDEDILSHDELISIGNQNFTLVEKWIQKLELKLQSKDSIFIEREFYPFKWHYYCLKILFDSITVPWKILNRLVDTIKPDRIGVGVGANPNHIYEHHLFFRPNESVYGMLAKGLSRQRNIGLRVWDTRPGTFNFLNIRYYKMLFNCIISCPDKVSDYLIKKISFRYFSTKHNLLVGNTGYDIDPVLKKLTGCFNFYYYHNPLCIRSLSTYLKLKANSNGPIFPEIDTSHSFNSILVTENNILDTIFGQRIQNYADRFIPVLWNGLNYIESLDDQKKFKAFIHIVGSFDAFTGLIVNYFDRVKKPVIVIQHGSYGYAPNRLTEYSEFGHNGYFIAWGSGISEMYDNRKKGNCTIVSTGSHLIENIKKNRKIRKVIKKVCYVPYIGVGNEYYPNGQPCRNSKLFLIETAVLKTLKSYVNKFHITFKVAHGFLGKETTACWCKENIPEIVIDVRPLRWIIHEFDFFIIDFPSTALVQTLATGAEVVVYTGNPYHTPTREAHELLNKRAIVETGMDDFLRKISSILDKGYVKSDIENMAFLKKYGVHLNDNNSLKRMAEAIQTACCD